MVGAAEPAVDDDQPAAPLDGALAVFLLHRHVPVDDVAVPRQPELGQDAPAGGFLVVPGVVGVLDLGVGGLVGDKEPLKGGHGAAPEQGRQLAAPQIPQKVLPALPGGAALGGVVAPAGPLVAVVHQGAAGVQPPLEPLGGKGALFGHGHRPVVEQVAVFDVVDAALGVEEADVLLQFFALAEGGCQLVHHQLLVGVEGGGVGRVDGGEARIPQRVLSAGDVDRPLCVVDAAQVVPPFHLEVGVAVDDGALQLEHDDRDGLVHDGAAVQHPLGVGAAGGVGVGHPDGQVVAAVVAVGQALQVAQVDAVAVLDHAVVVVGQGGLEDGGAAQGAAGRRPHPDHVVVAPLDVHAVVAQKQVQDDVGPGPAVEQVAHDVQFVHRQPLDQLAQPGDEPVGPAVFDDAAHDLAVVEVLVVVLKVGVEQLVQHIAAARRQAGAHIAAGVLGGDQPADVDQPEQGLAVPALEGGFARLLGLELGQLFGRVVDQGGQLGPLAGGHRLAQHLVHLFPNDPRGRVEDVDKGLVLPVQVAHEMLGALGQLEQGLGADDLAGGRRLGRVVPGQQVQIFQIAADLFGLGAHGVSLPVCAGQSFSLSV